MGSRYEFLGGNLSIDFVNTRIIVRGQLVDLLKTEDHIWQWFQESDVYDSAALEALKLELGANSPLLIEALEMRERMKELVEALEAGGQPSQASLDAINRYLDETPITQTIKAQGGAFEIHQELKPTKIAHLLHPIADAAAYILYEGDFKRVKQCHNENCILHFYDSSKNNSRRWCSMQTCGNRTKANRHYRRHSKEDQE